MLPLLFMVSLAVSSEGVTVSTLESRHPLVSPSACHAFGPQAVLEVLKLKMDAVNAGQIDKYRKILRYLTEAPKLLEDYYRGPEDSLPAEHGEAIGRLHTALYEHLDRLRLHVLLPWARLVPLQERADVTGSRQAVNKRALFANLRRTINETEHVEQKMVDNISELVEQFRSLYLAYKKVMANWSASTWLSDTPEQKKETLSIILNEDFPPMLGKPLLYLFEDKNLDFYYPYPCGYEEVFEILKKLRSVADRVDTTPGDDAKWQLLLQQLPPRVEPQEPRHMTQAELDMEEDLLATHIIDMMTGYPRQKSKRY